MLKTNKGFSLLEMLVSLFIVTSFMLLVLNQYIDIDYKHYYFMNDYLYKQSNAMKNNKKEYIDYGIYFNGSGHVNMAKSINIGKHKLIIHLATGYISCE